MVAYLVTSKAETKTGIEFSSKSGIVWPSKMRSRSLCVVLWMLTSPGRQFREKTAAQRIGFLRYNTSTTAIARTREGGWWGGGGYSFDVPGIAVEVPR